MPSCRLQAAFRSIVMIVGLVFCLGEGALAQSAAKAKVALVIGNSAYQHAVKLGNPTYDAEAVGDALARLGFDVTKAEDLGFDDMRRAILQFGRSAQGSDIAIIYFAGHGIEFGGEDWLVPTDADLQTDLDVDNAAINLKSLMKAVSDTQTLGLVILDACRTNPFTPRSRENHASLDRGMDLPVSPQRGLAPIDLDQGLAPVDPVENVLVAFAAKDGTVAQDGQGKHSPFTSALLSHIEAKDLEINFLFRNIRDDVLAATKNQQEPFIYGSLSKDYIYLNPANAGGTEGPPVGGDEIAWAFLKDSNELDSLQRFVKTFPQSSHSAEAQAKIAALLNPHPDWAALLHAPGLETRTDAPAPIITVKAESSTDDVARKFTHDSEAVQLAWDVVKTAKSQKTIEHFIDAFPTSKRRAILRPRARVSIAENADPARSSDLGRQQAIVRSVLPWTSSADADQDTGNNDLVAALSEDYETREDRRAKACDQLAADPDDSGRSPGIDGAAFEQMDGKAALSACKKAVQAFPDVPRYRFQLCRALSKLGRVREAGAQCDTAIETAAATGAAAAAYYVTFENINNIQGLSPTAGTLKTTGPVNPLPKPTPLQLRNDARLTGAQQIKAAAALTNAITQGASNAQGDKAILARVKTAVAANRNGRAALRAANGIDQNSGPVVRRSGALAAAARRFGASARALRAGAEIARIEMKPQVSRILANQAVAARMLARRTALAVSVVMPKIMAPKIMAPRVAMIKIRAPRIVLPKISIMVPHIILKRP